MSKIKIYPLGGKTEQWAVRDDAPRAGWIGDSVQFCFPTKYQSGAVYEVVSLCLSYHKGNTEFATPILKSARVQLRRFGCSLRDRWQDGDYRYEIWWKPSYSAHDIANGTMQAIANALKWQECGTGYWPQDYAWNAEQKGDCAMKRLRLFRKIIGGPRRKRLSPQEARRLGWKFLRKLKED